MTPSYQIDYSYDELGRAKEVKEGTTVLASWSYPDRLNGTVTYSNATTRTVQLNPAGSVAKLTNALNGEAPEYRRYYNRTGQVTNQRVTLPAYEYSPAGTLTGYTPNAMNQYVFEA